MNPLERSRALARERVKRHACNDLVELTKYKRHNWKHRMRLREMHVHYTLTTPTMLFTDDVIVTSVMPVMPTVPKHLPSIWNFTSVSLKTFVAYEISVI